jgi:transcriptional regulator with PAS, ATPase and Fis domain
MKQKESIIPEEYQLLFDNMISACVYSRIVTDKDNKPINYRVLAVNKAYEKIIGKKADQVVGRLITEIHPDVEKDTLDWIQIYGQVALTGKKWETESYSKVLDKWVKIMAYCPQKGDFVVTFEDITARVKTEQENKKQIIEAKKLNAELKQITDRFNAFMDHIPAFVYIKNENMQHVYGNRELLKFLNRDLKSFIGSRTHELFKGNIANQMEKFDQKVKSELTTLKMEEYSMEREGTVRWYQDVKFPIILPDKSFQLGGIAVDISDHINLRQKLKRALQEVKRLKDQLKAENISLRHEINGKRHFKDIVGKGKEILYVLHRVEQVAPTDTTVLIIGETGVGKERFAQAVHQNSSRKDKPLIRVDCTTLAPNLIESELFGHEKGAFTGAVQRQIGRFELADGATIFLDEIAELPIQVQSKLLRVLQLGEFERLGSTKTIKSDVRIIAATNRDLEEEVKAGRFRKDLYYRLNVFPISIAPLRKRTEDIPLLIEYLLHTFNKRFGKNIDTISNKTMNELKDYSWPGNIRELENVIERAVITSSDKVLKIELSAGETIESEEEGKSLQEVERIHIEKTLKKTGWRVSGPRGAAVRLGMNPETLRSRMRKLGIKKPGIND